MLMSDWFTVNDQVENDGQKVNRVDSGIAATWVKIVSSWVSILLYIWTLAGNFLGIFCDFFLIFFFFSSCFIA